MSYTAKGRYTDPNGRSGDFVVESPSSDRRQIERIVRNRYDVGRTVHINNVDSSGRAEREAQNQRMREEERQQRAQAQQNLSNIGNGPQQAFAPQPTRSYSSGGGGASALGGLIVLGLPVLLLIGWLGGGDKTPTNSNPAALTIERTYEPAQQQPQAYQPPSYQPPAYQAPAYQYQQQAPSTAPVDNWDTSDDEDPDDTWWE